MVFGAPGLCPGAWFPGAWFPTAWFPTSTKGKSIFFLSECSTKYQKFRHRFLSNHINPRNIPIYPPYTPQVPPYTPPGPSNRLKIPPFCSKSLIFIQNPWILVPRASKSIDFGAPGLCPGPPGAWFPTSTKGKSNFFYQIPSKFYRNSATCASLTT